MDDIRKTKAQLTAELNDLRKQAEHERELLRAQVADAREEAANAKDRLNGILERVGDGFVAFDANFNYTYVNVRGGELLGRKADELIGKNYWSEYPEARGTPFADAYVRAMTTQQPVMLEDYYVHWDRWFENRIYPSREGITIFFTDVTERKQAEGALHRLNRELRALSDCNQILMRAKDEQTLLNDICHIISDEAGYRMAWVGYAEHDEAKAIRPVAWAGTDDGYLAAINITWADSERGRGPTGTAIRSGQSVYVRDFVTDSRVSLWREDALQRGYRSALALPLKDESAIPFGALTIFSTGLNAFTPDEIRLLEELAGDLAYGITTLQARVERERAESQREAALEALRTSETKFRTIFMVSSDGIYITQADGDIIVEANDAFANVFGYARDEIIGRTSQQLDIFYDISDREKLVRDGRAHGFIKEVEVKGMKKNGEIIMCSLSAQVISLDNRMYYLGAVRDITERKRAEEQLLRSQKLESLGVLAGGVAHDFNNLLAALLGQTSLAAAKLPSDHPAQDHLSRAIAAARRAADLTRQMLAYSGRGAFRMMPLNLNTLIRDNIGFLESSISKSIVLSTDLAEFLPLINADSGQMQQIVMNLVLNAAEAIGEHVGTISLGTSVIDITDDDKHWEQYTGQAVAAGRYVQLRVEDTGHGMGAKTLSHIFDPFFTTKFAGRGLGLAAVLGIVRGHRGGLWVESKVGLGTSFTVIFPVTTETEAAPTTIVQKMPSQQIVLVIDDEQPVLEAIADMLELDNISTLCVRTGAEGIALFRERHADIGLVLLDLSMPGLSGRETFDQLLQIDPQARIVLSSGYDQTEATRDFEGRKLAGFLHKPYDMDTLLDTVRQHLQHTAGE